MWYYYIVNEYNNLEVEIIMLKTIDICQKLTAKETETETIEITETNDQVTE